MTLNAAFESGRSRQRGNPDYYRESFQRMTRTVSVDVEDQIQNAKLELFSANID